MTIQKKSLISSLNTTKKAIVASTPATPSVQLSKGVYGSPVSTSKKLMKATHGPVSTSKKLMKATHGPVSTSKKLMKAWN